MHVKTGEPIADQHTWWLYDGDDQVVAWAGSTHPTRHDAERAARAFGRRAQQTRIELVCDRRSRWRWRAWDGDVRVASSSDTYASELAARRAATHAREVVRVAHAGAALRRTAY